MSACAGKHIVLVGMMGAGKSSVGRVLARKLHRPLLDSDELIEERTGRTVREIWVSDGEAAFRAIETATLIAILGDDEPAVVAAAGGVVLAGAIMTILTLAGKAGALIALAALCAFGAGAILSAMKKEGAVGTPTCTC